MSSSWCENCGRGFMMSGDYNARFCGDECRTSFHNFIRKNERYTKSVESKLHEMLNDGRNHKGERFAEVRVTVQKLLEIAHSASTNWRIECVHCGYVDFVHFGACECPECQHNVWHWRKKRSFSGGE